MNVVKIIFNIIRLTTLLSLSCFLVSCGASGIMLGRSFDGLFQNISFFILIISAFLFTNYISTVKTIFKNKVFNEDIIASVIFASIVFMLSFVFGLTAIDQKSTGKDLDAIFLFYPSITLIALILNTAITVSFRLRQKNI